MIRLLLLFVILVVFGRIGFAAESRREDTANPVVPGNNAFAFDLYARLRQDQADNIFFSPHSISTALAMTVAGARGETEAEMLKVLHHDQPRDELHRAFGTLVKGLKARGNGSGYRLSIADRLWGQRGYGFLPEYLALTRDHYNAELAQVDFRQHPQETRQTINDWVSQQTEGKIKDLLPSELSTNTCLVLTDAIYFKANWADQFDKAATHDAPFYVEGRKNILVPMMHRSGQYRLSASDGIKVLELNYEAGEMSMIILLPNDVGGLPTLEAKLTSANLTRWLSGLKPRRVSVAIPRFKSSNQVDLVAPLNALGITKAFMPEQADFSGINGRRDLFIGAALHQAFVDVHEEGTEAAAATAIAAGVRSAVTPPLIFRADHPFLFLIRDNASGSILFLGRMMNPRS